jgi:hypothetical protein
MKTTKLLMTLTLGVAISFAACKKTDDPKASPSPTPTPTPGPYTSLSKAYEELAPKFKTVTFNAAVGASFYGNSGTRYIFMPNSFVNASGALVTGNVDIEVLECINRADMIFGQMLTVSNGEALISAGEINVKATQAGSKIYIRSGMTYTANMPTNKGMATTGMEFFSGAPATDIKGSIVNWNLVAGDSLNARIVYDGDTVRLMPDSIGMSNADKYGKEGSVIVDVKLDGINTSVKKDDVILYYLFEGLLGAVPSKGGSFSGGTYSSTSMVKLKSHIVACAVYNGDFYGGISSGVTPTAGSTYTVTVSKTTPTAFKTLINALK